jgi:hypothetical protein
MWKLLGAAVVVGGGVLAPTAALAQGDYPIPKETPTATPEPVQVGGAQAARPVSGGATLPFTGGEIAALTVAGVGVTGAGVVLVGLTRRRRAHTSA